LARSNYLKKGKGKRLEGQSLLREGEVNITEEQLQIDEPIEIGEMAELVSGRKA